MFLRAITGRFFASGYEDGKQPFRWSLQRVDGGVPGTVITKLKNQVFSMSEGLWEITMRPGQEGQLSWCGLRVAPYDPDQVLAGVAEYEFHIQLVGGI